MSDDPTRFSIGFDNVAGKYSGKLPMSLRDSSVPGCSCGWCGVPGDFVLCQVGAPIPVSNAFCSRECHDDWVWEVHYRTLHERAEKRQGVRISRISYALAASGALAWADSEVSVDLGQHAAIVGFEIGGIPYYQAVTL